MTTPSSEQGVGLTIKVSPIKATSATSALPVRKEEFGKSVDSYEHTINAVGGYESATFTISDLQTQLEEYFQNWVGAHIEVYGPNHRRIWEGFVNGVQLNVGGLSVGRGMLTEIGNRIVVTYTLIDTTADPPASGIQTETVALSDTTSQGRYGIWDIVYSAGSQLPTSAATIQQVLLNDVRYPPVSQDVNPGAGNPPSLTVTCSGYWAWANAYIFNDATTGTRTVSAKIQAVLGGDPNGIFSTDYSYIDTNASLVAARERDNRKAWDLLTALASSGDGTNYYRWTLGCYDDRKWVYTAQPTTYEYVHRLADPKLRIVSKSGVEKERWEIRPAQWLFVSDFLIGRTQPTTLYRSDPRYLFIEKVSYRAPDEVSINGARLQDLPQLLAAQGLGGIY